MMLCTEQQIQTALGHLSPEIFEFSDESHLHAGHAGNKGGGHYRILVVSTAFNGIPRLQRQRMVKEALHEWFSDGRIHALSIRALTTDEYFHQI